MESIAEEEPIGASMALPPAEPSQAADDERKLAERARAGDAEAFGELFERHRQKAKGLAQRLTGDVHMADDVVQEALIRAFLHLGTLADTSRLLPWFYRIVRNQANMKLRRGGPYRKERPFNSLAAPVGREAAAADWEDLDSILSHLAGRASQEAALSRDPAELLLRKETFETIHALLHCLSSKEKGIFKAYFFRQLRPEEIAGMYGMTTGSIYTYIHRSRQKLRQEHIRASLGLIPEARRGVGMGNGKLLELAAGMGEQPRLFTLAGSLGRILAANGEPRSGAELMGDSGMAFRMSISEKTTFSDGLYIFDWQASIQELMAGYGYETAFCCGQLAGSPVPLLGAVESFPVVLPIEEAVLPFIRSRIDAGMPVLYFDTQASRPFVHEWSVIHGYDEDRRIVHVTDPVLPEGKTLPYEDVAGNPIRFLAAFSRKGCSGTAGRKAGNSEAEGRKAKSRFFQALRNGIHFANEGSQYRPRTSYLSYAAGLAAYEAWIRHLADCDTAPNRYGMGQLATAYAEAKRYAAAYLRTAPLRGEDMRMALLASEAYEQAALALEELSLRVPFVKTAEVMPPSLRDGCIPLLRKAKRFESAAVGYMELALKLQIEERGVEDEQA
ncbi:MULTISPECIES: RNA polymerase sigma factor [unclassified Paenibacillus]|uniref:RNA polymerase sigma factor n=1 Tax=unclassified Paenibacillus TaxID=185978 RepID=UPI000954DAD8|nr:MULTISPECIES: RNA polymerase sigma factor [unclassified Paenibacillus]ASS65179.1 RNA polymerase sigma factor [Paenibacillus sp. RUD330]SIQ45246.1 RNA polymerase sigma factor, sigma-70 family [Paenibacillus sp. RU4X]SIQ67462.1 RNA polymerase sigma factor, sigma-70 family [Paenibacillus sp. RU4T]